MVRDLPKMENYLPTNTDIVKGVKQGLENDGIIVNYLHEILKQVHELQNDLEKSQFLVGTQMTELQTKVDVLVQPMIKGPKGKA